MTKIEFIEGYFEKSKIITDEEKSNFFKQIVAIECNCEEYGCQGWQMKSIKVIELENKQENKNI